jgi:uncharacterized protein YjbI with pentapeptide repeats
VRAANVPVPQLPVVQAWRAGSVAVINDVYGAVQTRIADLPASPVRDFLHQGVVSVRAIALSVVGVRVGATPSCVSTGDCSDQDFSNQDLTGLYAPTVNFAGAKFEKTILNYADLNGTNLSGATLPGAQLDYAFLSKAVLNQATLPDAHLVGAELIGADLTGADLTNTLIPLARMRGAVLTRADLTNANLSQSNLNDADLSNSNLTDALLPYADLTGADLTGANLTGVTWSYATCPDGNKTTSTGSCTA